MSVDICNVGSRIFHEIVIVFTTHWDDDLLPGWAFGGHLDVMFQLWIAFNDIVNLVDFLRIDGREASLIFSTSEVFVVCFEA